MKLLSKIILIVTVILSGGTYLSGCVSSKVSSKCETKLDEISVPLPTQAEKENLAQDEIFVHLSPQAEVYLKNNSSYTGLLISTNSQQIKVVVPSSQKVSEDITNIEKVVFSYKNIVLCGQGLVIRGEEKDNPTDSKIENWTVSLDDLNLINPTKGLAKLKLKDLEPEDRKEIREIAQDSSYVVEQINFNSNSPEKITFKVSPR